MAAVDPFQGKRPWQLGLWLFTALFAHFLVSLFGVLSRYVEVRRPLDGRRRGGCRLAPKSPRTQPHPMVKSDVCRWRRARRCRPCATRCWSR